MSSVIEPAFIKLLFQLFAGQATAPTTIYMGLGSPGGSQEISATDGGSPAQPSGYARIAIQTSSLKVSGGTLTIPTQSFTFSAIPSPNSAANAWFLADAATGGNVYCSGSLGGDGLGGTIGAGSGSAAILVPTSLGALIHTSDTLKLGSTCAGNLEYVYVYGVAPFGGSTTTDAIQCSSQHPHPAGEAFTRDAQARFYSAGWVETVSASIQIVSQP